MRAALIVNPRSGRGGSRGLALADEVRRKAGGKVVAVLDRFADLAETLQRFAAEGIDTLFVSSGDGTVQAIQTELAERGPFPALPRLALLPHGTTNLTAAELGFREGNTRRLASRVAGDGGLERSSDIAHRHTLRVVNPRDDIVRHGMFLGVGAIARASAFCQDRIHGAGLRGDWATFAALVAGVAGSLLARTDKAGPDRIAQAHPMRIEIDGRALTAGDQLLFLATTLDRLILRSRPFWGGKSGPIRATAIAYPPPSVARWLLPLLYGGESRRVPASCRSASAASIAIATSAPVLLDGEFFEAPADAPLRIETGPLFTYLRS